MESETAQDVASKNSPIDSPEKLSYFHGKVSVTQVNSLLKVDGDFLIQLVDQASNFKTKELIVGGSLLVLSVNKYGKVRHWLIKQTEGKFGIEQAFFPSVTSMISFYLGSQLSIIEGENVQIKNAVLDEAKGISESDQPTYIQLPAIDEENNVSSENNGRFDQLASLIDDPDLITKVSNFSVKASGLDESYSGLAVNTSSSLDTTSSMFRCLGIGASNEDLDSSNVLLGKIGNNYSASANNLLVDQKNSYEEVRECKSLPVQAPCSLAILGDAKLQTESSTSSTQLNFGAVNALSDRSAGSTETWPWLQLFKSNTNSDSTCGLDKTQFNSSKGVEVSDCSLAISTPSSLLVESHPPANICIDQSSRSDNSTYARLEDTSNKIIEHVCSACSPSLNLEYDSVDKLNLRYNIAKATSFYEFVQLSSASNSTAPQMSTMFRLAELIFKDYQQHVVGDLQLSSNV